MQGSFLARRFVAWVWATSFARALWGSTFLHLTALAGLLIWASSARQIPGGGGRGGMQLDLSTGDGAPNGLLPLEMVGNPNAPPQIEPWAKDVMPMEIAVVAPPQLSETPVPAGPQKSSATTSDNSIEQPATNPTAATEPVPQPEIPPADVRAADMLPAPPVVKPQDKLVQSDRNPAPSSRTQTSDNSPSQTPSTGTVETSSTNGASQSGAGSPSFVGNLPPRYPDVAVENRWEGDVMLLLHIDTRGRVFQVEILHGSGHAVLDDEAAGAIRHWIGKPAKHDGMPVESTAQLPVHFRLK